MIASTPHLLYNGNKAPPPVAVVVPRWETTTATPLLGDYQ